MEYQLTNETEETGIDTGSLLELFKAFLAVLLPLIGLDFLSKYIDSIGA